MGAWEPQSCLSCRGTRCRLRTYSRVRTVSSMAPTGNHPQTDHTETAVATTTSKNTRNRRPVAVLGGNRIPFARSDGAYAQASNQDMFTAALDGLVDRFDLAGRAPGRGDRRRRAQAQPRLQPHARVRAGQRAVALHAGVRPAAGLRHRSAGGHRRRRRYRRGPLRGRPPRAGWTPPPTRPIAFGDDLRRTLLGLRRSKSNVERLKLVGKLPGVAGRRDPHQRRTPHRAVDG